MQSAAMTTAEPAYQAAEDEFMFRHAAGDVSELGFECLTRPKRTGREAYVTAWGPNEFTPTGTLKDFDVTTQLADIKQPTLIINGGNDLCTPVHRQVHVRPHPQRQMGTLPQLPPLLLRGSK